MLLAEGRPRRRTKRKRQKGQDHERITVNWLWLLNATMLLITLLTVTILASVCVHLLAFWYSDVTNQHNSLDLDHPVYKYSIIG